MSRKITYEDIFDLYLNLCPFIKRKLYTIKDIQDWLNELNLNPFLKKYPELFLFLEFLYHNNLVVPFFSVKFPMDYGGFRGVINDHPWKYYHKKGWISFLDKKEFVGKEWELLNKVEIIKVENVETLKIWIDIVLTGFEFPKELLSDFFYSWFSFMFLNDTPSASAFLAYYDGNPVASSAVFYETGVSCIYCVTTLEEARGKGIGTAITLAPLNEAKKLGYEIVILHSSEVALNMYKHMGFKEYCRIDWFIWQPDSKK